MTEPLLCLYSAQEHGPFYVGATAAAFAPETLRVATPLDDDVVVTDLSTNRTVCTLEGDGETVTALCMTPDGSRVAVVSQSQQLRVFDVELGAVVKQHRFLAPVYMAVADATLALFAFGATDGVVYVWDVAGLYMTHTLKGHGTTICGLAFHGELHLADWVLALGDTMGTAKVWSLEKRKCVATLHEHSGAVRGVAILAEYYLTGGRDEVVVVYKRSNLRAPVATFAVRQQVEALGFTESGFYTAGAGGQVRVWDMAGHLVGGLEVPLETLEDVMVVDVARVDSALWATLSDQTLVQLEPRPEPLDLGVALDTPDPVYLHSVRTVAGNHGTVAEIRFAGPGLTLLAMATNAPALRLVDPAAPLDVALCTGHTDLLNCVDATPDGLWLVTGSKDGTARVWRWNNDSFELHSTYTGHAGAVTGAAFSRLGPRFIVTALADLTVKKWSVPPKGGDVRASDYTRRAHEKEINAVAIAPNDEYFATASLDKTAKVWLVQLSETVGVLRGHRRGLWDVTFCDHDKLVATALGDKTVKVWLLKDYLCTATHEGHTNAVQRVRFLADRRLVSLGADGLVKVWAGECLATLDGHANRVWALDTRDAGRLLVLADADGYVSVWRDTSEELVAARAEAQRMKVENEQTLANHVAACDWGSALVLALTLDHPMRVYNVFRAAVAANADPDSPVGSHKLEATIKTLAPEQVAALLRRVRDWNTNFKQCELAQSVLAVVLPQVDVDDAAVRKIVDLMIPYNERHYQRLDGLIEDTYVLDWVVAEMEKA